MSSAALGDWEGPRADRLDELVEMHVRATGREPGRRWGTQEFNRTLITALIAQFQAFARDLHDLSVEVFVEAIDATEQQRAVRSLLTNGRRLNERTPRRAHLGSDFGRLGLDLIPALKVADRRSAGRLDVLDGLTDLRNAIGHGNEAEISRLKGRGFFATLPAFRRHRRTFRALARTCDLVVATELSRVLSTRRPW